MKSLAGHQPYFFPYIGYFSVINSADIFVYGDSLQYEKESWINRNRIISESGEVKYIIVPTKKASLSTPIKDIQIDYTLNWEKKIINQLGYYRNAPYYNDVIALLEELFSREYHSIADLNMESTNMVMTKLGIDTKCYRMSELNLEMSENIEADEWGIVSCKSFANVDTFINAPGGRKFYSPEKYHNVGLEIKFMQNRLSYYDQRRTTFIPGLSIIDVMMFNSPEDIKKMLNDYYTF